MGLLVVAISVVIGVVLARRWTGVALLAAIVLRVLIPPAATASLLGEAFGSSGLLHPSNVIVAVVTVTACISRRDFLPRGFGRHGGLIICLTLLIVGATFVTAFQGAVAQIPALVANFIVPILYLVLALGALRAGDMRFEWLTHSLIAIMAVESVLILLQSATQNVLVWERELIRYQTWFVSTTITRPFGTFDNPIEAAAILASSVCLLVYVRNIAFQVALLALMSSAVILTQSRFPSILLIVAVLFVLATSRRSIGEFFVMSLFITAAVVMVLSTSASGLVERFAPGADSSLETRSIAWDYIVQNISSVLLSGGGYRVGSATKGIWLESSLESSYAILLFDLGAPLAIAYLLIQCHVALAGMRTLSRGYSFAAFVAIGCAFAFSGFANPTSFGPIIWTYLGVGLWGSVIARARQSNSAHIAQNV